MLTVYGTPTTRTSRVLWALEEAGADYQFVKIDLGAGGARSPEYRALNPGAKVPTLVDDDVEGERLVLTESAAIVLYVADRFPQAGLCPTSHVGRASCLRWCFFALSELEQPLWTIAKHTFALPPSWRVPAVKETASREWERALEVLAAGLGERAYILGDAFSAADILIGHTLAWGRHAGHSLVHANLRDYARRALERPAWKRARARETR